MRFNRFVVRNIRILTINLIISYYLFLNEGILMSENYSKSNLSITFPSEEITNLMKDRFFIIFSEGDQVAVDTMDKNEINKPFVISSIGKKELKL